MTKYNNRSFTNVVQLHFFTFLDKCSDAYNDSHTNIMLDLIHLYFHLFCKGFMFYSCYLYQCTYLKWCHTLTILDYVPVV